MVTPEVTKRVARRTVSPRVSSSSDRVSATPDGGMQYVHRSEQRSVSEMRR